MEQNTVTVKPWWNIGPSKPVVAWMPYNGVQLRTGTDIGGSSIEVINGGNKTVLGYWPDKVLTGAELEHISYNLETCDCQLCAGGRAGAGR